MGFVSSTVCTPGEYIVRAGDIGNKIYFIHTGKVQILVGAKKTPLAVLGEGDSFGEYSLLFSLKRTAWAQALTFCDLYSLSKNHLEMIMKVPAIICRSASYSLPQLLH